MSKLLRHDLGEYLREQRHAAQLSLRQLADLAGISNPYLSQIERGLKRPSAEILQQLARGLQVSAESLYVRAGILEAGDGGHHVTCTVPSAIAADPRLSERQRAVLVEVYESFVGPTGPELNDSEADEDSPGMVAEVATDPSTPATDADHAGPLVPNPIESSPRRSVTRRRRVPTPVPPTAAALTTRRPSSSRSTDRELEKE